MIDYYIELIDSIIHRYNPLLNQVRFEERVSKNKDNNSDIQPKKKNNYNSLVINSEMTAYRPKVEGALFCRIKETGKKPYISFRNKYKYWFDEKGVESWSTKSDEGFFRITPLDFLYIVNKNEEEFSRLASQICIDAMSFPKFGCCSKYKQCSDVGRCVHEDLLYSSACEYRHNLEAGKNFYKTER